MKKITIILALLLCTTFAFAQIEAKVDGDATLTWGIDLDSTATGFTNAFTSSIDFDLVPKATETLTGDAPYGSITLKDFKAVVDEDGGLTVTEPAISAKLLLTPDLSVAIYGAPSFTFTKAKGFLHIGAKAKTELDALKPAVAGTTGGLSLTYSLGDLGSATVKVASHDAWDAVETAAVDDVYGWLDDMGTTDTSDDVELDGDAALTGTAYWGVVTAGTAASTAVNTDNEYSAGLDVTLSPADLISVGLGAIYGDFAEADLGFYVTADIDPADLLSVDVKLDGSLPNGGEFDFDAAFGVDLTLTDVATIGVDGYYGADDLEVGIDASVSAVENLSLSAAFDLYTLLTELAWKAQVKTSYNIDGIKPYLTLDIDDASTIGVNAGVELTGMMENTTFKVDYKTADISNDIGDVEASVKIAY